MKKCKDHTGKEFESITKMCEYWNISKDVYKRRIKNGWSIEKALTTPVISNNKKCKDHKGNEFDSVSKMCKHWKIPLRTYNNRIEKGWSIEKALTTPPINGIFDGKKCKDHLGNEFDSITDMCKHWNISKAVYDGRIKMGWSIEKALTTPIQKTYKDHLGHEFKSILEMCKYWGITTSTYANRISRGWTIEKALTTPIVKIVRNKKCKDHTGKEFNSITDMCKHWNIAKDTYSSRIKRGWSIKKALTTPTYEHNIPKNFKPGNAISNIKILNTIYDNKSKNRYYICLNLNNNIADVYTKNELIQLENMR